MTFLYTATRRFDKTYEEHRIFWDNYIEWSKLTQLTEVIVPDADTNVIAVWRHKKIGR